MPVSAKVAARISAGLKRYKAILESAKQRDVSESDTVVIIVDMLSDVLGYEKYHHITTEHSIRGTYVDLAVIVDGDVRFLLEAKAVGIELKDSHVKQAIDYGANKGIEWVVLTNGTVWRVYRIHFAQPIDKTLVFEIDLLSINLKDTNVIECFGNLSREAFSKDSMSDFFQEKQITNKFSVAALLLSDAMLDELRRELRRVSPGLKVDTDYLGELLQTEVIKRELVDSDEAKGSIALIKKLQKSAAREKKKKVVEEIQQEEIVTATPASSSTETASAPNPTA